MEPAVMELAVGVDLGQRSDPTAVVVTEVETRDRDGHFERVYTVRDLGRLPLGTSYPDVAKKVADVVRQLNERDPDGWPALVVDATGVGRPVVDILRNEVESARCSLHAVTFTHGDRLDILAAGEMRLGKAYLVSTLQACLQTDRLKLPVTRETEILVRELLDYEIRIDQDANDRYGAFAVGTHDDLVTALGLTICHSERAGRDLAVFDWVRRKAAARPEPTSFVPPGGVVVTRL